MEYLEGKKGRPEKLKRYKRKEKVNQWNMGHLTFFICNWGDRSFHSRASERAWPNLGNRAVAGEGSRTGGAESYWK